MTSLTVTCGQLNDHFFKLTVTNYNTIVLIFQRSFCSHHKRTRKHSESGKPRSRKSTTGTNEETENNAYELILQLEEPLQEFVQDDLTSKSIFFAARFRRRNIDRLRVYFYVSGHRFDFARRDKRRFSAKSTISSILNRRPTESSIISSLPLKIYKKHFDHSPHEVTFVNFFSLLDWKIFKLMKREMSFSFIKFSSE